MKKAATVCATQCRGHRKYKRRPCGILWPFMLAALLEIFFRTTQKDTGKLKSFLWQNVTVIRCFLS